ncbi:MAG: SDR family NAD(P)-dependent oxidoreductase [Bacteroidales bacterium]|nr:SDR family NAD(P)-dependent oxidoreductase [Bacteroidales bacterium]
MKILVTGAAGFIGSHTCVELLKKGHTVVGLDNMNDYYDVNLKKARVSHIRKVAKELKGKFSFTVKDIEDGAGLEKIFRKEKFDKVCNLAAQAGVRYSFENPASYIKSNLIGFFNILELCVKYKVKHLVYASSSSVYGNNAKVPFSEDDRTDDPQSLYAATKKSNELMAHVYSKQYNLPATGLRFFTVYGPWGRPDMAPFKFMRMIIEGETIEVYNHGNLSRDFSYIDDIVKGVVKVLEGPNRSKREVYNIGNSSPVALMDFIGCIEKSTGKKAKKRMVAMQRGDVYTTFASVSHLKEDYGFAPNTPLQKGIDEFYNWYKAFYKID